jgi:nicotinate-nucleotide--dimethylbenzimidazole phosphoribosyltransferase
MPITFETPSDFAAALEKLPRPNPVMELAARRRQAQLTKPPGSLGRLEEVAVHLAAWQADGIPVAEHMEVAVFASNHGVTAQGVSPYPAAVTEQMVENFKKGGAAINAIADSLGLGLRILTLKLDEPTADITEAPAMSVEETLEVVNAGAGCAQPDTDVLILGELGIGNTTIAAALSAAAFGGSGSAWAGPGTGLDPVGVARKASAVDKALLRAAAGRQLDAFEMLRQLGGRETAAIAGAVLAARLRRIPVILDGYVVTASLAPLFKTNPAIVEHCLAGHLSAEPAHSRLLKKMGLSPLLSLGMRLGEGTGAALAAGIVRAAVAAHTKMATFEEAAVENRPDAGQVG